MAVTQDRIEEEVVNYILQNGAKPKYLLLDEKSYDEFNLSFKPKLTSKPKQSHSDMTKFYSSHDALIDIMPIKTDKELFELVR